MGSYAAIATSTVSSDGMSVTIPISLTFSIAGLDAGDNPYLVTGFHDGCDLVLPWLSAAIAQGPTARVCMLPSQAASGRFEFLGDLLRDTIGKPAWGASDPKGLALFHDGVRDALRQVISRLVAERNGACRRLRTFFATVPAEAFAFMPYDDRRFCRAILSSPTAPWISRAVPWLPTAILPRIVVANPSATWVMRALARLGGASEGHG